MMSILKRKDQLGEEEAEAEEEKEKRTQN